MKNQNIPRPDEKVLPEEEREECRHIAWLLGLLDSYREDFEAALELIDYTQKNIEALRSEEVAARKANNQTRLNETRQASDTHQNWQRIAMRDAVMSVYHFGFILDGILKSTHRCPTLMTKIDLSKLHTAQPLYKKHFPKPEPIRHAVAHVGETQHSLHRLDKARFDGTLEIGGATIQGIAGGYVIEGWVKGTIYGWTMHMTHEKKLVSLEISPTTHDQLKSIAEVVFAAFRDDRLK